MIKIIIILLILLIIFKNINEHFQPMVMFPKPLIFTKNSDLKEIPHNPKIPLYLFMVKRLKGYSYYVGGGKINSYYTFGFKPEEVNLVLDLNKNNFRYDARTKTYLVDKVIDKSKLIPILSLAIKEYNNLIQTTIEKLNDVRDRMYKFEEKMNKEFTKKHLG